MDTLKKLFSSYRLALCFAAGALVGAGLYASGTVFFSGKCGTLEKVFSPCVSGDSSGEVALVSSDSSQQKTSGPLRPTPVYIVGTNALAVNPQAAGNTVEVTMATFSEPGWVAIHEEEEGAFGRVLGAQRFEPGIHLGEVELLRPTVPGGIYAAVLYRDVGDSAFDLLTDPMLKGQDGKIIKTSFTVY